MWRWRVDAIVTDLPYGVRSAAVGIGAAPGATATPANGASPSTGAAAAAATPTPGDMLGALLRLAAAVLRPDTVGWCRLTLSKPR
jgi:tRNA G10  N-methylase Trm11